jgi:hypothetical protein
MDNFTTVFVFSATTDKVLGDFKNQISTGVANFIFGLMGLLVVAVIFAKFFKNSKSKRTLSFIKWYLFLACGGLILWSIVWTNIHFSLYTHYKSEYARLQAEFNSQQYRVAEGIVHVLHAQAVSGHDQGDIIKIGDVELEVDAYVTTFGYKTTIAHGGALTEGTYARVFYDYNPTVSEAFQYTILEVDIRK